MGSSSPANGAEDRRGCSGSGWLQGAHVPAADRANGGGGGVLIWNMFLASRRHVLTDRPSCGWTRVETISSQSGGGMKHWSTRTTGINCLYFVLLALAWDFGDRLGKTAVLPWIVKKHARITFLSPVFRTNSLPASRPGLLSTGSCRPCFDETKRRAVPLVRFGKPSCATRDPPEHPFWALPTQECWMTRRFIIPRAAAE